MIEAPRVRQWAHDNALTLVFLSLMFIITWAVTIIGLVIS